MHTAKWSDEVIEKEQNVAQVCEDKKRLNYDQHC